ncbi:hypothetical protein [Ponticaulis koreensis]|uniref:hypothetical protein n=1 Tax=Ponticaulis koreensis TaxID=1123045 RepID=UPI000486D90A|nr:hypothetical protein [Ponticaulis koreensis]
MKLLTKNKLLTFKRFNALLISLNDALAGRINNPVNNSVNLLFKLVHLDADVLRDDLRLRLLLIPCVGEHFFDHLKHA